MEGYSENIKENTFIYRDNNNDHNTNKKYRN